MTIATQGGTFHPAPPRNGGLPADWLIFASGVFSLRRSVYGVSVIPVRAISKTGIMFYSMVACTSVSRVRRPVVWRDLLQFAAG